MANFFFLFSHFSLLPEKKEETEEEEEIGHPHYNQYWVVVC